MKSVLAMSLSASIALFAACAAPAQQRSPSRISNAELPSVDPLAGEIARNHHGKVSSKLKMCVATSGDVEGVTLVSSSGLEAYDEAVLAAVADWRYEKSAQRTCKSLDVTYRTP